MAPVQKKALFSFMAGLLWAAMMATIFVLMGGIDAFERSANMRLALDGIFITGLVAHLINNTTWLNPPKPPFRPKASIDERDQRIIASAPNIQVVAVLFTLAAWTVGLTEAYHGTGQVPSAFLYLIMFSTIIVMTIAFYLGLLIGYWKAG